MARLRLRAGVWYYRAKLPADVRKLLNRAELTYSLRTADEESATALSLEMSARQLRLCRAVRQAPRMTSDQIDALVRHFTESYRDNREGDAIRYGELVPEFASERQNFMRDQLREAQEALTHNRLESTQCGHSAHV